ncbi:hypothetical protein [Polynucleobacter brandtiae]|uniref:Uncharacterized protein n=1 Tax=Polynucleobacter brandtiae TaxID=1938816 RepID=A0A2M8VJ56_9BURK|nr:hypothetical protein [Polynucleobacter brandtiae]PJI76962.1 hypothetical protein B0G85_1881 [Polynucleobacter brandtiae]
MTQLPLTLLSEEKSHAIHIERYLHLTKNVMPILAKTTQTDWPVQNDHCFQRIVLDAICDGPWYDKIIRPAYQGNRPLG